MTSVEAYILVVLVGAGTAFFKYCLSRKAWKWRHIIGGTGLGGMASLMVVGFLFRETAGENPFGACAIVVALNLAQENIVVAFARNVLKSKGLDVGDKTNE